MIIRSMALALFSVLLIAGLSACGGGGGGEDDGGGGTPCAPPGSLTRLALAGEPAPDTDGGTFGSLTISTQIAAGGGGWAAFVAPISGGDTSEVLYAVQPNGTRVRVLAAGDNAPDAATGDIESIDAIRVSGQGWVLARVGVIGGSATQGLVAAHVTGGGVGEIHGLVYDDLDLSPAGLSGTLADIPDSGLHIATFGTTFFQGTTTDGDDGFWKVNGNGSGLTLLLGSGSTLGGLDTARALYSTAVSEGSARYAVVVEQDDDTPGTKGVYVGRITGGSVTAAAVEGDEIAGDDKIADILEDQNMVVYQAATTTGVLFEAGTNEADTSILLGSTATGASTILVAREGDAAPPVAGVNVDLGTYGRVRILNNGPSCDAPVFGAELLDATSPITFGLLALQAGSAVPVPAFVDGVPAPPDQVGDFTSGFLGIGVTGRLDVASDGAIVFANVLTSGHIGVYWSIPACGLLSIARSGGSAPGGGTWAQTTTWRQTTANGVLVFLAPLTDGRAGIYRQGP